MSNVHFIDVLSILSTLHYPCVQNNMIKTTHLHLQNAISPTLFRQNHPSTRYTIWNVKLCFVSQVLKHRLRIWSFSYTLLTPCQPQQKPLFQKTVKSSRHHFEEGRKWWYRIKNSCAGV